MVVKPPPNLDSAQLCQKSLYYPAGALGVLLANYVGNPNRRPSPSTGDNYISLYNFFNPHKVSFISSLSAVLFDWFGSRQFVPSSPRSTLDSLFFNFQGTRSFSTFLNILYQKFWEKSNFKYCLLSFSLYYTANSNDKPHITRLQKGCKETKSGYLVAPVVV